MRKLILLTLIISTIVTYAQTGAQAKWGPTYKMSSKLDTWIACEDETGFYVVRSKRRSWEGVKLEKYDHKMNLKYSEELVLPKKNNIKMLFEDIVYVDKKLYMLASYTSSSSKDNYYYAYPIDDKGKLSDKSITLDHNSTPGKLGANYTTVLSKDSTKLLLYYNPPFDKKEDEKFKYKVFDKSLNLIWEKEIELPFKDKLVEIEDYIIDNDANVFMLLSILPDRKKGEKETKAEQAKKFIVLSYIHKKKEFNQYEVKLKDKWIESIDYDYNPELNQLTLGGFYSDDFKMNAVNGLFYMKLDINSGEVQVSSYKPFDKEIMTEIIGEKKAEKGKGLGDFVIRQFLSKKDGGAYIIAEQHYVTVTTTTDPKTGATSTRYHYHYNGIIVASINPKGDIEWIKLVKKASVDGSGGYYLSYAISHNRERDQLNIVFNDNLKNYGTDGKAIEKITGLRNIKKSVAAWVNIDSSGKMKRSMLFSVKELDKIILQPKINMRTDNDITVYGIRGKEYKFGKISFK